MPLFNATGEIGTILIAGTNNITGNMVVTLLLILIIMIAFCLMFGIELEFISVLLLPLCISMGSYYNELMAPIIVILIYVSTIIAKNWLFR